MRRWPCARVGFFALLVSGSFAVCGVKAPPRPPLGEAAPAPAATADAGTGADTLGLDCPPEARNDPNDVAADGGAR